MALLSWLLPILLVSSIYQTYSTTTCPQNVTIEKGTNYSINCTTESDVKDFYWYKGPTRDQDLIGSLESEKVIISETYNGDYDVSQSGALLILNARIIHEHHYHLVTFDRNRKSEEDKVVVNITISPESPCPLINNCTSCTECDLLKTETSSGTLTCRVQRSRPAVPLRWKTLHQSGISVDFARPIQKNDPSTDAWDSSVSIKYSVTSPCGARLTLQCLAEDTLSILNSAVTTTEITTVPCQTGTVTNFLDGILTTSPPGNFKIAAVLIPVLVIPFGIGLAVAVIFKFRKRTVPEPPQLSPLLEAAPDSELVKDFIQTLKDKSNEKFCYLQPLPWGDKIDIELLYTESLCKVTTQKGKTFDKTSTELTKTKNITDQRLVTFIGEHGDGRTTFFKNVVCEWSKGMEEFYLVIFIPIKEVKKDKSLSKYLIEDILNTNKFEIELVEAILKSEDKYCLVILDGLEDLSESFGNGSRDRNREDLVTIAEILQGRDRDIYRNCHVWISSREEDWNSSRYPKQDVKVEMKGFSDVQLSEYIKTCCCYYCNKRQGASNEHATGENNDIYREVQKFFKKYNIFKDFKNTPLLINLMVHILATGIPKLPEKPIENMGTLIHVVVKCMKERHKNKNRSFSDEQFSIIENKLGEIAVQYKTKLRVKDSLFWEEEIGEEYVNTAKKIGLLKIIKKSTIAASYSGIEFCHQHIQEYLAALAIIREFPNCEDRKQTIENWGNDNSDRLLQLTKELNDFYTTYLD